jgi:hypothetical protein
MDAARPVGWGAGTVSGRGRIDTAANSVFKSCETVKDYLEEVLLAVGIVEDLNLHT